MQALWDEAIADWRAHGLEPSDELLAFIEANVRGTLTFAEILQRVMARELAPRDPIDRPSRDSPPPGGRRRPK